MATSNADGDEEDIESSIQKEIDSLANKQGPPKLFTPVFLDLQCVLFFKTRAPVEPVDFVRRLCEDAKANSQKRSHRFVNRLTPMTMMGRATEKGLQEVGRAVLGKHFQLAGEGQDGEVDAKSENFTVSTCYHFRSLLTVKSVFAV